MRWGLSLLLPKFPPQCLGKKRCFSRYSCVVGFVLHRTRISGNFSVTPLGRAVPPLRFSNSCQTARRSKDACEVLALRFEARGSVEGPVTNYRVFAASILGCLGRKVAWM